MLTTLNFSRTWAAKSFMSMAGSLGSRSSFSGASIMERNAQAEMAKRERGSFGNLIRGDCGAASTLANPPANASAAHAAAMAPTKRLLSIDTVNPPNERSEDIRFSGRVRESAQIAPVVEFVGVFGPAVADVGSIVHVGNQNVFDARVDLRLGLLHGLAQTDDDEDNAGSAGDEPLTVYLFHVFDVNLLGNVAFKDDGVVFGKRFERSFVVEGKWRNDDANADLEAAARAPLGFGTGGKFPEEVADGREHAFLLDADRWISEAGRKFERIDAVAVDDAIQVDVADVAFFGEFRLHFQKCAIEEQIRFAPEHGGAHFAGGRADFTRKKFFVLEVDIYRRDEFFAVKESADRDFDAVDAALQLENFNFVGKRLLVRL